MGNLVQDYKDIFGKWRKTYNSGNDTSNTVSGHKWNGINDRCKVGGSEQRRKPSYVGCTVSDNFKDFQFFTEWHISAPGYLAHGYHLDKDLLKKGNKVYGEENCVLIPQALNCFLVDAKASRGKYKQGVGFHKRNLKYQAQVSGTFLGYFDTEEEAHLAYCVAKEALAHVWYERLKAGEFIVDERVIERMRTWTLEE